MIVYCCAGYICLSLDGYKLFEVSFLDMDIFRYII